ncbi:MarR family transcriptional regulator [Loigolactobacillus bifermentans]|jgi:DNA-binding MarR family transcriptional regulator|nr:MarR family transcriptional regulator [Loigolactobacillus bifermentans]QGG60564.1 winged helix DNA-binding protein [Loigolactobacillus bifermentans]
MDMDLELLVLQRQIARRLNQWLGQECLPLDETDLLLLLIVAQKARLHQRQVADYLALNAAHVTRLVHKLVVLGYLEQMPDDFDRRRKQLGLTTLGEKVVTRAQKMLGVWQQQNQLFKAGLHDLIGQSH